MQLNNRVVIFANGTLPDLKAARALLDPDDFIVAADGGVHHVSALGLVPAVVIGDMDSIKESQMRALSRPRGSRTGNAGIRILRHPRNKDRTDLELALNYAQEKSCSSILVLGAFGGRLDQTLANLALLTDPALQEVDIRLDDGIEEAFFVSRMREVHGRPGDLVSLLPWGKPVQGVTTQGLKWPLHGEILYPYRTRGISNEMAGEVASVRVRSGPLLVVHRRKGISE